MAKAKNFLILALTCCAICVPATARADVFASAQAAKALTRVYQAIARTLGSAGKSVGKSAGKTAGQSAGKSAAQAGVAASEAEALAAKAGKSASRAETLASQTDDVASRAETLASQTDDVASRTETSASQTDDVASRTETSAVKEGKEEKIRETLENAYDVYDAVNDVVDANSESGYFIVDEIREEWENTLRRWLWALAGAGAFFYYCGRRVKRGAATT